LKRSDRERLDDIAEAIATIHRHSSNRSRDELLRRDAILYNLVILGEAVKGISDEMRGRHAEVPWRQIAGLRDFLAHEYYRIDMTVIREIVKRDLGPLAAAIASLRNKNSPRGRGRSTPSESRRR
jgi:uncharacterized protein with HEPN domain